MQLETSISIAAPPERVWATIMDVERWPEWTQSIARVAKLDAGEIKPGARIKIKQPKIPTAVWEVTRIDEGRYMEWRASSPGVSTVAGHRVEPEMGGSIVTLSIDQTGWAQALIAPFFRGLTKRYIEMEARGLKTRCEGAVSS